MGRVYGEPVNVQARKDGRPTRFVWRGRLYAVRSVMEHWVVNQEWWRETGQPQKAQADEPELRFWRVEASAGQGVPSGVYELRQDVASGAWTLRRVLD